MFTFLHMFSQGAHCLLSQKSVPMLGMFTQRTHSNASTIPGTINSDINIPSSRIPARIVVWNQRAKSELHSSKKTEFFTRLINV